MGESVRNLLGPQFAWGLTNKQLLSSKNQNH